MTISAQVTITQRLWRGWDDPGLPVGAYIASQTVTGDASGGTQIVFFDFAGEGDPVSGRYYNVEQLTAHHSDAATVEGTMRAINWESVGPTGLADRIWSLSFITDGVGDSGLNYSRISGIFPVFLGQPQPVPALASTLDVRIANSLNRVLFAQIQGYIWEPRSNMVDGGLRRPVEALYGH